MLLKEALSVNPWASDDPAASWTEVGENVKIAGDLECEVLGRTVRMKVDTMLKHFKQQDRKNLKK